MVDTTAIETRKAMIPSVQSPSPATKICGAESAKFKSRRTRNKKAKVPASPSTMKETKDQTIPAVQTSKFGCRLTPLPIKSPPDVAAIVLPTLATFNHTRNVSDPSCSSGPIFVGRSRNGSSSSSDEDKPSTGKTTPHRLSDASDKSLDLLKEFAPDPIVEVDSAVSRDEHSLVAGTTTTESVTEVLTEAPAEETLIEATPAEIAANEEGVLPSTDEALLATVADDMIPLFLERAYEESFLTKDDSPTSMGAFRKTVKMVQQMVNASAVVYLAEGITPNVRLVNSLDVYHYSALPNMILSSEQVVEQAAFDLAMSKHRDDLIRHTTQEEEAAKVQEVERVVEWPIGEAVEVVPEEEVLFEDSAEVVQEVVVAPPKDPQTKTDEQMNLLFSIGLQSVFKNGTWFPNPQYKPFTEVTEDVLDVEQNPAIVTMVASLPSGNGLVALLPDSVQTAHSPRGLSFWHLLL